MRNTGKFLLMTMSLTLMSGSAYAQQGSVAKGLVPHKALYDIDLVATHSGSQIVNISGQMVYEWKKTCDAWLTDHHFTLFYEYADSPGIRIKSDFSTLESFDGKDFNFSSRRHRNGELYQDIRGYAALDTKGGKALYNSPAGVKYDLKEGSLFPMAHTIKLIEQAQQGTPYYVASIFDGSDEEGPVEISSFVLKPQTKPAYRPSEKIDENLLSGKAWKIRMAVFPEKNQEEDSDYEMSLVFHQNGIISDMLIQYDDFAVTQKLVSLEPLAADFCGSDTPE